MITEKQKELVTTVTTHITHLRGVFAIITEHSESALLFQNSDPDNLEEWAEDFLFPYTNLGKIKEGKPIIRNFHKAIKDAHVEAHKNTVGLLDNLLTMHWVGSGMLAHIFQQGPETRYIMYLNTEGQEYLGKFFEALSPLLTYVPLIMTTHDLVEVAFNHETLENLDWYDSGYDRVLSDIFRVEALYQFLTTLESLGYQPHPNEDEHLSNYGLNPRQEELFQLHTSMKHNFK